MLQAWFYRDYSRPGGGLTLLETPDSVFHYWLFSPKNTTWSMLNLLPQQQHWRSGTDPEVKEGMVFFSFNTSEITLTICVWNRRERKAGVSISQPDDIFKDQCLADPLAAVRAFRNSEEELLTHPSALTPEHTTSGAGVPLLQRIIHPHPLAEGKVGIALTAWKDVCSSVLLPLNFRQGLV